MDIRDLFIVRATCEENNNFIITIGKHLATEKRFKSKEEALAYIITPEWDTIVAMCGELIEAHKVNEQIEKDAKKIVESIVKKTKED